MPWLEQLIFAGPNILDLGCPLVSNKPTKNERNRRGAPEEVVPFGLILLNGS